MNAMKHHQFEGGDRLPLLGLGTWKSAPGEVGAAVRCALDLGYRHFDCAAIYGNEREIGDAFRDAFDAGVVEREELWVTSKLWCNRHREEDVALAARESIEALGVEYLDLYLVHWPVAVRHDVVGPASAEDFLSLEEVPLEETWAGMVEARELGLARHVGVSNYNLQRLEHHATLGVAPEVNQVELHPYLQQRALVEGARSLGMLTTAYSPLGSSDRPETMKGEDEPVLLRDETVAAVAEEVGATPAQVLIAWAMQRGTAVIPKSVDPGRLAQNLAAASLSLTAGQVQRIDGLERSFRYVTGTFWERAGGPYPAAELWGD